MLKIMGLILKPKIYTICEHTVLPLKKNASSTRRASIVSLVGLVRPWMDVDPSDEGCRHPCGHGGVDRQMDRTES